jgi:hypothetical protein
MKTYSEKLKDPRWQKKRLEIMERDGFACQQCGDEKSTLSVHHAYYVSKREPWQYPNWSLSTLCNECHENKHNDEESDANEAGFNEWEEIMGFMGEDIPAIVDWWDFCVLVAMKRRDGFSHYSIVSNFFAAARESLLVEKEATHGR